MKHSQTRSGSSSQQKVKLLPVLKKVLLTNQCVCVCLCVFVCERVGKGGVACDFTSQTLTDEEDGEGDEEEKDVWHHIEGVQEAAVVQNPRVHVVGHRVILVPTERQGHGGAGTLRGRPSRGRGRRKTSRDTEGL